MVKLALLAVSGAAGTLARYGLSNVDYRITHAGFPVGTFVVNIAGSFLIGMAWGFFERTSVSPDLRLFVTTGFLGGFTTFSAFGIETFNLMRGNQMKMAFLNIALTNLFGIFFVIAGFMVSKFLLRMWI